jgi:hypothetical protein
LFVKEHVARHDEPDALAKCRLRRDVTLVAPWEVIMRQHENV